MPAPSRTSPPSAVMPLQSTTTSGRSTGNIAVQAGDLITVTGSTEDSTRTLSISSTPSITWTERVIGTSGNFGRAYIWTGVVASTGNINITVAPNATSVWSAAVRIFPTGGNSGLGASSSGTGTGDPTRAITTTGDNSTLVYAGADWNAIDNSGGITYTNVNGLQPEDTVHGHVSGASSSYSGVFEDAGAAGSKTVQTTAPDGQAWSLIVLEVLGTAGATEETRPDASTDVTGWTNTGGAASHHAALADESDTTYINATLV